MNVRLEQRTEGVILPVKASPGARENALRGVHDGQLKVSVTAAPEKGKANKAIIEVLARTLDLKRSQIEIIAGETSSEKKFLIRDCTAEDLAIRLTTALAP
ncbi:MAG: DUF167 domain-containing protein [Planctomycetia bacterium]|nr:DUF167 domain-containing protein [Planctomycetia bacterium]